MKNELSVFLSTFESLSEEEAKSIAENITVSSFKKGSLLLKAGELSKECYFILKGCVRKYYLVDGEEKTVDFYTEQQSVVSFTSYAQQIPADHYLSCVEDCIMIAGETDNEQEMYDKFPKLEVITRKFIEQDLGKNQDTLASFITSSPEERYLNLLKTRPELIQRVPQHQLASYLGVTPESLSRIKKRITLK